MTQDSFSPVPRAGSVHVPIAPPPRTDGNALAGVGLMLVSTLVLTGMHFLVRYIGSDIHAFEIAFFRNLFGAVILIPLIWRAGPTALVTTRPLKLGLRSVLGTVGMLAWFYGLTVVPTAEATALSFGGVVFASIGAVIFLGEIMRVRRWTATALCLAGMLVMIRPGFETINFGIVMILISTMAWGVGLVLVKSLSRTESTICIVTWTAILMTVQTAIPAWFVWTWPTATQLLLLFAVGTMGSIGHLTMTRALQRADATLVLPLDFVRLVWAAGLGYLLFAEFPDSYSLAGSLMIVAGAVYIVRRERTVKQEVPAEGPGHP